MSDPSRAAAGDPAIEAQTAGGRLLKQLVAFGEVLLCSGLITQIFIAQVLVGWGYLPFRSDGRLSIHYVVTLLLADAAVLVGIIFGLLRLHGESARAMFLGRRPPGREALLGIPLIVPVFGVAIGTLALLQHFFPWLHNVSHNPLEELIRTPRGATLFAVVAVIAGGLREEIQRAFLLRRFEHQLGGRGVGLLIVTAAFGAGHAIQGWDAVVTTALLGALWAVVYFLRGSIVAPVVSHATFDVLQIFHFLVYGP